MLDQSFLSKHLVRTVKKKDIFKDYCDGAEQVRLYFENKPLRIEDLIQGTNQYTSSNQTNLIQKSGANLYTTKSYAITLLLRRLDQNIKKCFNIETISRTEISKNIIKLLNEDSAFSITKLDIKSFYENINHQQLLAQVRSNRILSPDSKKMIETILKEYSFLSGKSTGIPRGISSSSLLSEIYLEEIDYKILSIDGIFYYARYVDDLIIFHTGKNKSITKKIKDILSKKRLLLNNNKTKNLYKYAIPLKRKLFKEKEILKKNKAITQQDIRKLNIKDIPIHKILRTETISHLGYKYSFEHTFLLQEKHPPKIVHSVELSDNKMKKLYSRIFLTMRAFAKDNNERLFTKRLLYLMYPMELKYNAKNGQLFSGVKYDYINLTHPYSDLHKLNHYLKKFTNLNSKGHFSLLSLHQKTILKDLIKKYNFIDGYIGKRFISFDKNSPSSLEAIFLFEENEICELKKPWDHLV